MKAIRLFTVVLLCGMAHAFGMDEEKYSSSKKNENSGLRNSKEEKKEKVEGKHITRKKGRRPLISSKEEHMNNLVQEWEEEQELEEQRKLSNSGDRKVRSRSGSITITQPFRRSSTGQMRDGEKKEKDGYYSPQPKSRRNNSSGSIEITPENLAILKSIEKRRQVTPEKRAIIKVLNKKPVDTVEKE